MLTGLCLKRTLKLNLLINFITFIISKYLKMRLLILLFITAIFFFSGKPAKDTIVFLQDSTGKTQIGFQTVGEKGKAAFQYLNEGSYRLVFEFPQQEGKWIKEKARHRTLTKATFNKKNKTYYYQGTEGFFSVEFKRVRKIDRKTFHPVFKEVRGEASRQIVVAEFIAKRNGAQFSLQIKKLTAAQFKKATDKIGNDISMISIRNIK